MRSQWIDNKKNIWEIAQGKNSCSISLSEAVETRIEVPAAYNGLEITEIEKKAFLSKKELKEITLPETIEKIGDWAFSHAMNLHSVYIPLKCRSFGKKIFLGCEKLERIYVASEDEIQAKMVAIGVRFFEEDRLLSDSNIGSDDWYEAWDKSLIKFIQKDDLEGFTELWCCGEEDYEGKDYDIECYPVERRFEKLRIIYFRLINNRRLADDTKTEIQAYIKNHSKGQDSEEAWNIIVDEYGDDLEYYRVLIEADGLNAENFNKAFDDVQEKNAQVKAYLLKWKKDTLNSRGETNQKSEFDLGW